MLRGEFAPVSPTLVRQLCDVSNSLTYVTRLRLLSPAMNSWQRAPLGLGQGQGACPSPVVSTPALPPVAQSVLASRLPPAPRSPAPPLAAFDGPLAPPTPRLPAARVSPAVPAPPPVDSGADPSTLAGAVTRPLQPAAAVRTRSVRRKLRRACAIRVECPDCPRMVHV